MFLATILLFPSFTVCFISTKSESRSPQRRLLIERHCRRCGLQRRCRPSSRQRRFAPDCQTRKRHRQEIDSDCQGCQNFPSRQLAEVGVVLKLSLGKEKNQLIILSYIWKVLSN